LDGPLPKLCPVVALSHQDGHHSAVALLLKAALIQVSDYRLLGASGYSSFLKSLGQVKPNLVGMFIVWFFQMFLFLFLLIGSTRKKQEAKRFQTECCLWRVYFSTNLDHFFFFFFVDQKYTKETRGQKVSNRVLFVESLFFYQS
jgi:hypothetical protein